MFLATLTDTQLERLRQNVLRRIHRIGDGAWDFVTLAIVRPGIAKAYQLIADELHRRLHRTKRVTQRELELAAALATRHNSLESAEWALSYFGALTFGIESVDCADRAMRYVNLGDTYDQTVIAEGGDYSVSSWGDWYENAENEHCEDENVLRCGYCGEFTPHCDPSNPSAWDETICEHCGRNVSSGNLPDLAEVRRKHIAKLVALAGERSAAAIGELLQLPADEIPADLPTLFGELLDCEDFDGLAETLADSTAKK
jgi:hypothetical protein